MKKNYKLKVSLGSRSYPIYIGKKILVNLKEITKGKKYSKVFLISDTNIRKKLEDMKKMINNLMVE